MLGATSIPVTVVLLALLVGLLTPVLVQLFLTLRSLQKVLLVVDRRLDKTLGDLSGLITHMAGGPSRGQGAASAIGAAVVPAIVAGIRALRHRDHDATDPEPETRPEAEKAESEKQP